MIEGPRFQASELPPHVVKADRAIVIDTVIKSRLPMAVCSCRNIETANIIAFALNRHFTIENGGAA